MRVKPFIDAHEFGYKGLKMKDHFLYIILALPWLKMVSLRTYSALLDPMFVESRPLDDIWLQVIINFGNELES